MQKTAGPVEIATFATIVNPSMSVSENYPKVYYDVQHVFLWGHLDPSSGKLGLISF